MIPRLTLKDSLKSEYNLFLESLSKSPFSGEIRPDFASRLLMSTDNSIYQILPQAVIYPRTNNDLVHLFKLANQEPFKSLTFSPRGGGTGTNGQSLSPGIIIDCSKYMNQILELNLDEKWVLVQPGVVLDQLNLYLQPYRLFFAPHVAPSNRATIGGMINTDACGKGSRIYGKTSNHVLELSWVLSDGTVGRSHSIDRATLEEIKEQPGTLGKIYRQVAEIVTNKRELIEQTFPKMPRFMTGYNLANVSQDDFFNLNWILTGSEGTLAVITEAKLKLTSVPKYQQLMVIHYDCFDAALAAAQKLLQLEPSAIETIDDKVLELAKQEEIYHQVKDFIGDAKALNLVEFIGDNLEETGLAQSKPKNPFSPRRKPEMTQSRSENGFLHESWEIENKINQVIREYGETMATTGDCFAPFHSTRNDKNRYYLTKNQQEIAQLWELRKKGVGLLANTKGERKPIAFIEDTAVPPVNLANYIRELKALLNDYHLDYAMYGHVDVGCLHVRPTLDMKVPTDEALIRELSDKVVTLVRKYGGVIWGEHGKGFRSEYTPLFFGELYEDLRKIKTVFDPDNRLNPGKIVTPLESSTEVVKIEAPLRGHFDRQVSPSIRSQYQEVFSCNGNGICFNFNPDDLMCPSYKGMSDRIHSPKGRASLLREWLRQLENQDLGIPPSPLLPPEGGSQGREPREGKEGMEGLRKLWNTLGKFWGVYDYSHEVYEGMQGCLSCKACVSQCPVHIDIPYFKGKFLELYYTRYLRHWRDYVLLNIETLAEWESAAPLFFNSCTHNPITRWIVKQFLGIIDLPMISELTVKQGLSERQAPQFNLTQLSELTKSERENTVILLQDAFTSFSEAQLVLDTYDLLRLLGYTVYVSPFFPSGKILQVKGFLRKFQAIAEKNTEYLTQLGSLGVPLIGIEPSIVLTYRDEYPKLLNTQESSPKVQLLQEFLVTQMERLPSVVTAERYYLLSHCMEKSLVWDSPKQWQQVFHGIGIPLMVVSTGCCGMAGIYGHEVEHFTQSKGIYEISWGRYLSGIHQERQCVLVTGFSCRSQVKRFEGFVPQHPVQALLKLLKEKKT